MVWDYIPEVNMWGMGGSWRRPKKQPNYNSYKRKLKNKKYHMRRIPAELKASHSAVDDGEIISARLMMNDFTSTRARLFLTEPVVPGQKASITFEIPSRFYVRGIVTWCKIMETEKTTMQEIHYPFRAEVEFEFTSQEEANEVAAFSQKFFYTFMHSDQNPNKKAG